MENYTNVPNVYVSEAVDNTTRTLSKFDIQRAFRFKSLCNSIFGVYFPLVLEVVGIVGCFVSFLILFKFKDRKSPFNFMLRGLMVADGLYLLSYMIDDTLWKVYVETDSRILEPFYKYEIKVYYNYYEHFFSNITYTLTWGILVMLSCGRYYAVCKPFKVQQYVTHKRVKLGIILLIVLGVAFDIPTTYLSSKIVEITEENVTYVDRVATDIGKNKIFSEMYFIIGELFCQILLPLGILTWLNVKILIGLKKAAQKRASMISDKKYLKDSDKNFTITIIIVANSIIHMIEKIFTTIILIIQTYEIPVERLDFICAWKVSDTITVLSPTMDSVLFTICSQEYRDILISAFTFKCQQESAPKMATSENVTVKSKLDDEIP